MMTMSGRSFSYHRLKKLPPLAAAGPVSTDATEQDHHNHQPPPPPEFAAAAIQESYQSYYRALGAAAAARGRRHHHHHHQGARRRRRPRLRISRLARALRRKAEAVGGSVRASVARVARRLLKEGRPYIGDLFAGNYMFMQVAPSPTMSGNNGAKGFAPFADYYYAIAGTKPPAPAAAAGAVQLHTAAAAAGALYKV